MIKLTPPKSRRRRPGHALAVGIALLLVSTLLAPRFAAADGELAGNDPTLPGAGNSVETAIAQGRPSIRIVTPEHNATVPGPAIEVRVDVENFILDGENIGGDAVPGYGHWHLFVDGVFQVQTAEPAATATLPSRGIHRITVSLSNNDHTSLDPPVVADVVVRWLHRHYLPIVSK